MKTINSNSETHVCLLDVKLTLAEKRLVSQYSKAKRIEKKVKNTIDKLKDKVLALSSKVPASKLEYITYSYETEQLAKLIYVEKFTVDSDNLKTNFAQVYERVKQDSSHVQLRLS